MRAYLQEWSDGTHNIIVHAAGLPFGWRESNLDEATEESAIRHALRELGSSFGDVAWMDETGTKVERIVTIKR